MVLNKFVKRLVSGASDNTQESIGLLIIYGTSIMILGTATLILFDRMSLPVVPTCPSCEPSPWRASCLNLVIQSCGEGLCLFAYYFGKLCYRNRPDHIHHYDRLGDPSLPRARWYHWLLVGTVDAFGTFFLFLSNSYVSKSVIRIARCSILTLTAFYCIVLFKRDIRLVSWIGLVFISIGQAFTAIDETILDHSASANPRDRNDNPGLGAITLILGVLFASSYYVCMEWIWVKCSFDPIRGVGLYGWWSTLMGMAVVFIAHVGGFENVRETTYQLIHSPKLISLNFWFMVFVAVLNVCTLIATGLGSALFTSTILTARNVPIWFVGLYTGSSRREPLAICGVLFLTFGFAVYTNAVTVFLPKKWRDYLQSDFRIQCVLLRDDEEYCYDDDDGASTEYVSDYIDEETEDAGKPGKIRDSTGNDGSSQDPQPGKGKVRKRARGKHGNCEDAACVSTRANEPRSRPGNDASQYLATIHGEINITKCPEDFYENHDTAPDDQWIFVEKEMTITVPVREKPDSSV